MNKTSSIIVLMTLRSLTCAAALSAQTPTPPINSPTMQETKVFVGVNAGGQTQSHTLNSDFSFPIYGQTASVATTAAVDGGPIFDLNVGYRFGARPSVKHLELPSLGVAVGFSSFSKKGSASGAASIPSPIFFNRPASVTIDPIDAQRKDRSIYIVGVVFLPITDRIDLAAYGGPSVIRVQQELIANVSVPAGTQTVDAVALQNQSGTATGVNVGVDLAYLLAKNYGVGAFIRYNGGSVDLDTASDVKAGGLQLGVGVRLRF